MKTVYQVFRKYDTYVTYFTWKIFFANQYNEVILNKLKKLYIKNKILNFMSSGTDAVLYNQTQR